VKQVRNVIINYAWRGIRCLDTNHHLLESGRRSLYRRSPELLLRRRWKDLKEALANVEIIIQEWLETAKELGRAIPARAAAWPSPTRLSLLQFSSETPAF